MNAVFADTPLAWLAITGARLARQGRRVPVHSELSCLPLTHDLIPNNSADSLRLPPTFYLSNISQIS